MFGFSLQKLIVLVAVIAAVWYGFKFISRLHDKREAEAKLDQGRAGRTRSGVGAGPDSTGAVAQDMVQCQVCEAYVPARGAGHCGRDDCPY
ncbi:MAG: hypothetical protein V3T80_04505 [Kiloniellales bacterium]